MKFLYEAILTPWSGGWEAEFPDLGICTQGTLCSMRLSWRKIC